MHNKLETSVKGLAVWVDKILIDSKGTEWRLSNFLDTFNIHDFQKFYSELQPHVLSLKLEESALFGNLVSTYESNSKAMSEAMKDNFLHDLLLNITLDLPFWGRSANDLIEVLRQIHSNSVNLVNALQTFRS